MVQLEVGKGKGVFSKLLGTPFGLNLNTLDADKFLYN